MSFGETAGDFPQSEKPYFFPDGFDLGALPLRVQLTIKALILPLYQQLVLGAVNDLERSMASSFVMDAVIEVDLQFEVGAALNLAGKATPDERAERDRLVDRLQRLVRGKQRTAKFMHMLRVYREKGAAGGA